LNTSTLLEKLNTTPSHHFAETIAVIEQHYDFEPTAFENGIQHNAAGENSGSCKLFALQKCRNSPEANFSLLWFLLF
jgi:hypothetical protein